jgi:integrase
LLHDRWLSPPRVADAPDEPNCGSVCAVNVELQPAARKLGIGWVNWLVLRRSYVTWLRMVGIDPGDRQSLMRHSRFTTTAAIYEQDLPESQIRAIEKLGGLGN